MRIRSTQTPHRQARAVGSRFHATLSPENDPDYPRCAMLSSLFTLRKEKYTWFPGSLAITAFMLVAAAPRSSTEHATRFGDLTTAGVVGFKEPDSLRRATFFPRPFLSRALGSGSAFGAYLIGYFPGRSSAPKCVLWASETNSKPLLKG